MCPEPEMPMYAMFTGLVKIFDAVSKALWCVLKKFGFTRKLIHALKALYGGMLGHGLYYCVLYAHLFHIKNFFNVLNSTPHKAPMIK